MAARTLVISTPAVGGVAITAASGTTVSSDTMVISCSTAQASIDCATLAIRLDNVNSTTTVVLSLAAGTLYSSIGQGAKTITIPSASTYILGGQGFESARFLSSTGTLAFTQSSGAGPLSWEAYQKPHAIQ